MNKKALLVGINYPKTDFALRGCVNDVTAMSNILTKYYGFKTTNKRMLTDNSATTANIIERLEWLVDSAQEGDVLYFHFSGHGSQYVNTDYNNDVEPDGLDELLVPVDLDWRTKIIKDDDLKRIFKKVPNGVNLTVIADCCHSGDMLDSTSYYQPELATQRSLPFPPDSPNKNRFLSPPADIMNRSIGLTLRHKEKVKTSDNAILISGCQSHQTSADAWIHDKYIGAATHYLIKQITKTNGKISYKTLVEKMNKSLSKAGYTQRPELNGNSDIFNHDFLQPLVGG